jgi:predicted metal-binding protein
MPQKLEQIIDDCGFEFRAALDPTTFKVLPEVRDMCAAEKCRSYGGSWSCPPACGSLEYFTQLFSHYSSGYVFQTVGTMEDDYDYESMVNTDKLHNQRFKEFAEKIGDQCDRILLLGAGTCRLCETCTYPDEPCRHPELMHPSMEATGLLVSDICIQAGIPYYHGKNTLTFVSCALIK